MSRPDIAWSQETVIYYGNLADEILFADVQGWFPQEQTHTVGSWVRGDNPLFLKMETRLNADRFEALGRKPLIIVAPFAPFLDEKTASLLQKLCTKKPPNTHIFLAYPCLTEIPDFWQRWASRYPLDLDGNFKNSRSSCYCPNCRRQKLHKQSKQRKTVYVPTHATAVPV